MSRESERSINPKLLSREKVNGYDIALCEYQARGEFELSLPSSVFPNVGNFEQFLGGYESGPRVFTFKSRAEAEQAFRFAVEKAATAKFASDIEIAMDKFICGLHEAKKKTKKVVD